MMMIVKYQSNPISLSLSAPLSVSLSLSGGVAQLLLNYPSRVVLHKNLNARFFEAL